MKKLESGMLLLNYLTPNSTDCILICNDSMFRQVLLTSEGLSHPDTLFVHSYNNGTYEQLSDGIEISVNEGFKQHLIYTSAGYYVIKDGNKRIYYYVQSNAKLKNRVLSLLGEQEI
ncbi:hypothetical protein EOD41_13235 [Mucilaginibacter limnophilus]|uniref:Uncharacterized protein n=1 Tax=Mucilaginibacter limnophilus TaxID=1932778 RepID=A0A437MS55_9SPHI|nr:hypothetical protein [Mucilaginibacter limnophilus]RVU00435.1 hypothetical protein EOD41_13235 [Mucilaginibacter limnophilus]